MDFSPHLGLSAHKESGQRPRISVAKATSSANDVPEGDPLPSTEQKRFLHKWKQVQSQRSKTSRGRLKLLQLRSELRQKRRDASNLESSLQLQLKELLSGILVQVHQDISKLSRQLLDAYSQINTMEDAYVDEEDQVDADENLLDIQEKDFYAKYSPHITPMDIYENLSDSLSSSPDRPPMRETIPIPRITNPLYDYEMKVGRAKVLRETLDTLVSEYEKDLQSKARGEEMDPVDVKFLNSFEPMYNAKVKELRQVEEEMSPLEKDAIDSGLLHPSAAYSHFASQLAQPLTFPFKPDEYLDKSSRRKGTPSELPSSLPEESKDNESPMEKALSQKQPGSSSNDAFVEDWLSSLPKFNPFGRVLGMVSNFPPLTTWLPSGRRKRNLLIETESGAPTTSVHQDSGHTSQEPSIEPHSSRIPRLQSHEGDPDQFEQLSGVGHWNNADEVPSQEPRDDWIILSRTPEVSIDKNNQRYRRLWSFLFTYFHRQGDVEGLERSKTSETQPARQFHSTRMDMEADVQESRSI